MKFEMRDVPPILLAEARNGGKDVEAAAEANDDLMHKYLEGHNLSNEDIKKGLRIRTIKNEIVRCCAVPRSRTRACRRCSMP